MRPALPGLDRAVIIGSIVGLLAKLMFAGGEYVGQLWMFWIAPIAGAALAGIIGRVMYKPSSMIETVVIDRERSDPSIGNAVV